MKNAKVIVLEGVNGVGKSFIINKIHDYLAKKNYKIHSIREPGGTRFGEKIVRPIVKNQSMEYKLNDVSRFHLYMAARADNIRYIQENTDRYDYFLIDRFTQSTLTYNLLETEYSFNQIYNIEKHARMNFIPTICFYLHGSTEMIIERVYKRDYDELIKEDGDLKLDTLRKMADKTDKLKSLYVRANMHLEKNEGWEIESVFNGSNSEFAYNKIIKKIEGLS